MKRKILLITNQSNTVINFRKELIAFLLKNDFEVSVISGDSNRMSEIEALGVNFVCVPFSNRSKNPFQFIKTDKLFQKEIKRINPDIVFTFQIKPNLIGVRAAKKCKIKHIFSMVEGLGDPFQPKAFTDKIIQSIVVSLYKSAFKHTEMVFFLNPDDRKEFINRKIISENNSVLINGIGIDTKAFCPRVDVESNGKRVLMLSRLMINKGVMEYCEVGRKVRVTRKDIEFYLFGAEGQITSKNIESYTKNGDVIYCGETDKAYEEMCKCALYISTSFREGFPRTILEAMSVGKPVVASNVIGNNYVVVNKQTGYLVGKDNIDEFASRIIELIDNRELAKRFGDTAREICINQYDSNIINKQILNIILRNVQ